MGTRRFGGAGLVALAFVASTLTACGGAAGAPATNAPPQTPGAATTAAPKPTAPPTSSPLTKLEIAWESSGTPAATGQEPATYSPAVDPQTGDIWVAVSFSNVIWIFGADGTFKDTFGRGGKGDGEFNFVRPTCTPCGAGALAFAPDGTLFVADVGNQRIQKFDPRHRFVKAFGSFGAGEGQFADANQIATDGKFVYVVDDARQDLQVFDLNGTYVRRIPEGAGWLAVDPTGNLFASNARGVTKYSAGAESVLASYALPDFPNADRVGLTADGTGHLYYNLQRQTRPYIALALGEYDIATGKVRMWADGGETIAVAPDGSGIYAGNFVNPQWPKPTLRKYAIPAS
jgi:DNA-binding beta-propeller fold protein YncE